MITNRPKPHDDESINGRPEYFDYETLMTEEDWPIAECEKLPSTHELYILYTSGTTG